MNSVQFPWIVLAKSCEVVEAEQNNAKHNCDWILLRLQVLLTWPGIMSTPKNRRIPTSVHLGCRFYSIYDIILSNMILYYSAWQEHSEPQSCVQHSWPSLSLLFSNCFSAFPSISNTIRSASAWIPWRFNCCLWSELLAAPALPGEVGMRPCQAQQRHGLKTLTGKRSVCAGSRHKKHHWSLFGSFCAHMPTLHTCIHVFMHTCTTHAWMHACTDACMHTCRHTCIH